MRRVISLSALVSSLLALPAFAAPGQVEEGGGRSSMVSQATEAAAVEQLEAMMESGPADVGGMRKLNRRMAARAQAKMSQMLAAAPGGGGLTVQLAELPEGLQGDFPNQPARIQIQPAPPTTSLQSFSVSPGAATFRDFRPITTVEQKTEKTAFLGVTTSPATATLREQLGLPKGIGLVVDFVSPDSPAAEAGLKVHDVLQKLDDQLLINSPQFTVLVRSKKAGDTVTLTVIRGAKPIELKAKLIEKELQAIDEEGMEINRFQPIPGGMAIPGGGPEGMIWDGAGGWQKGVQSKVMVGDDGSTTSTLIDADGQITLRKDKDGKTTITAKDKAGKEIYSGPFATEDDKKKVPAEIAAKAAGMKMGEGGVHIELGGANTGNVGVTSMSVAMMNRTDDTHSISLSVRNNDRSVTARDAKSGKVLYEGPANTDEDFKKMPADIAEKVKAMAAKLPQK